MLVARPEERLARRRSGPDAEVVGPQPLVTRSELEAAFFALYDLLEEVRKIRLLLDEDDGEEAQEDLEE
jgi:hypothetical protein